MKLDSQQVEIVGKQIVIANLIAAGLEVAEPIRDRGIDLIAFRDGIAGGQFIARPLQIKTSSGESFELDKKYRPFDSLRIVEVWLPEPIIPNEAKLFSFTYDEAERVLNQMGYNMTKSWNDPAKPLQGRYRTRAGKQLKAILEREFRINRPEDWLERLGFPNVEQMAVLRK